MNTRSRRAALPFALLLSAFGAIAPNPAHALTAGTATNQYNALGTVNGASGVLIDDHWVLTAAHVARGSTPGALSFAGEAGTAVVDALYFAGTGDYPGNDLALLHLASALDTTGVPVLEGTVFTAAQAADLGTLTLVSAQNQSPQGRAQATALTSIDTYTGTDGTAYTTHWLVTGGPSYVEGGDSGSAAFLGVVANSANSVLAGIASAQLTTQDNQHYSAYVQVGAYRSWIDGTVAVTGDTVQWTTPVPDAPGLALVLAGLPMVARRRRSA